MTGVYFKRIYVETSGHVSCELGQIMTRYDFLEAGRVILIIFEWTMFKRNPT